MGNCLGLPEIFRSPERLRPPVLQLLHAIHPSVTRVKRANHSRNGRGRRVSCLPVTVGAFTVLDEPTDDVKEHYDVGGELGRGQFGVIRFCSKKQTGEKFACKSIAKGRLYRQKDVDNVRREIRIMRQLVGHPNVVELKDVYEDDTWVHIVMELCEGGDLFDRIRHKKIYSEKEAAATCKILMEALIYCHNHGVIHRDVKPENILLKDINDPATAKLADFGLAIRFLPGEKFCGVAGSAYYIAPEVLRGEYGEEVDVWSAGVVLYILLSGVPPFWGDTEEAIFDSIRFSRLDLCSDSWPNISAAAKDLIKGILRPEISKRLTPQQVLNHPWIVDHTQATNIDLIASVSKFAECIIDSSTLSWHTETTLFASSCSTVNEVRDHTGAASVTSPASSHVQRVGTHSNIQSLTGGCMISASLPNMRYCRTADTEGLENNQPMLQHSSLPEIIKISGLELVGSCNKPPPPPPPPPPSSSNLNVQPGSLYLPNVNASLEGLVHFLCNSCTILHVPNGPQNTVVLSTSRLEKELLVVHDPQCIRFGCKRLEKKESSSRSTATVFYCSKRIICSFQKG